MTRRACLITLLGLAGAARSVGAQPASGTARIGLLSIAADAAQFPERQTLEGLRELGWVEGRNLVLEQRYARGDPALLAQQAADLVRSKVDLVLTFSAGVRSIQQATQTIPVVFGSSQDPVRAGFVASLARPGGNLTGATYLTDELSAKRLALTKEILPGIARVAVLWEPAHIDNEFKGMQAVAGGLGLQLQSVTVPRPVRPDELEQAMAAVRQGRAEALVLAPGGFTIAQRRRIIALAASHRIPVVSAWRIFTDDGALLSYGPNLTEVARRIASYVDRILRGGRPADLPVEGPTRFELVLNLKTARLLELPVPRSLLLRADEVIA